MAQLRYKTEFNTLPLQRKIKKLTDATTRRGINQIIAEMSNRYVPYDTGKLRESVQVGPKEVRWTAPYARYMYYGKVYGPNIPITAFGNFLIGFWSPPGQKKHPTGKDIVYHTGGTTSHWVDHMIAHNQKRLPQRIEKYLKARSRELGLNK